MPQPNGYEQLDHSENIANEQSAGGSVRAGSSSGALTSSKGIGSEGDPKLGSGATSLCLTLPGAGDGGPQDHPPRKSAARPEGRTISRRVSS